ncbi:MAG: hypothetical protein N4A49_12960 [Marinifilaceae bacterium]|jgi:hypothetical protein|nr:hypothetical protein [Marinifilaceae bacterium]
MNTIINNSLKLILAACLLSLVSCEKYDKTPDLSNSLKENHKILSVIPVDASSAEYDQLIELHKKIKAYK